MASHTASIAYLAVARISDQTVLAERTDKGVYQAEGKTLSETFRTSVQRAARQSSNMSYHGWKDIYPCASTFDGSVYALADSTGLFIVGAGVRGGLYPYPPRLVWEMLGKLVDEVRRSGNDLVQAPAGGLNITMKKPLQELIRKYSEPGEQDAVTQVQEKVDAVKGMMQENVRKIIETHTTLEALQDKSHELNSSSEQFVKSSTSLKRQMQIRNIKVKALMAISVTALGVYVMLPFLS
jgi:hypothetical protein